MPTIYKFENAACWLDGISLVGSINEVELPEISWSSVDHECLGFVGTLQHANKVEPLEATITWAAYSPELAAAAANPYKGVSLQIRANYGVYTGANKVRDALGRFTLQGRFMNNQLGTLSPGEHERETVMMVDYVKEEFDGSTMLEFSVNPPIFRYNGGENIFAAIRNLLGI